VVISDKEIGRVQWGTYTKGKRKGQVKYGFDVISWWKSLQSGERMTKEEVLQIITSRLPTQQPVLEISAEIVSDHQEPEKPVGSRKNPDGGNGTNQPARRSTGKLYRQTRRKLTHFWLGIDNPTGWLEKAVIVTARLIAREGLTEEEAINLLMRYAREIPVEARHCSSRLSKGDWRSIDQDIAKAVKHAYRSNGKQGDAEGSERELSKTIAAWSRHGFKISDKATWDQRDGLVSGKMSINWTENDRRNISLWLKPALKVDDDDLALRVATGIVELTRMKEIEGKGWGYKYLKQWLPDKFGIPCGKQSKQAAVFKALIDLRIIRVVSQGRKGQATRWTHGSRVWALLDRDDAADQETPVVRNTEEMTWMGEELMGWGSWYDLEGEEKKGSTYLCSLINTSLS
jgi:hypothetical protein